MHQSHAIPWNAVADRLQFVRGGHGSPQQSSGLVLRRDTSPPAKDLRHFVHCLRRAIREFAQTEIAKVEKANQCRAAELPRKLHPSTPLFPDDLLDLREHPFRLGEYSTNSVCSNQLTQDHRYIEYWVRRAGGPDGSYTTAQGDLADSVKLLVQLGQSESLLRLCHTPPRLKGILSMGWGHSFGVNHVVLETLPRYLLINLGYAVRQRQMSELMNAAGRPTDPVTGLPRGVSPKRQFASLYEMDDMRRQVRESFTDYDYCTQFVMHRAFWRKYTDENSEQGSVLERYVCSGSEAPDPIPDDPTVMDVERTRRYLSDCFRSLYLVDLILLAQSDGDEVAANVFWENEIVYALCSFCSDLRTSDSEVPQADGSTAWVTQFE